MARQGNGDAMDFSLSDEQSAIRESVKRICDRFGDDYWRAHDDSGEFPAEFHRAIADGGWLGIAMPEEYGGAALGVSEAAILMHTIAGSAGAMAAASSVHINIFGPHPIVVHGTAEQKQRWLPPLIKGETRVCFGVTEPDAGLDTGRLKTRADNVQDGYVVHGQKIWTTTAREADKILMLARTTPREQCRRSVDGLTLFFTDLDRNKVEVRLIPKMGRHAVDSNQVFIDGLNVPKADRIGEEGKGFDYLLHGLNPERILVGAEAVAIGQHALERAVKYAKERIVFGRPIGQNQGIQHPLAESWMELDAAWLACLRAAWLYDRGKPCGPEANAAKYLGAEAGFNACTRAVMTHGGMGYAREFDVERLLREVMICRIAPVSPQLILCHIAEKALGLPKSY
jgi:acyl-CoA dehydrogenase